MIEHSVKKEKDKVTITFWSEPPKILRITERAILFTFMGRSFWAELPKIYAHAIPRSVEDRKKLVEKINQRILLDKPEGKENEVEDRHTEHAAESSTPEEGESGDNGEESRGSHD